MLNFDQKTVWDLRLLSQFKLYTIMMKVPNDSPLVQSFWHLLKLSILKIYSVMPQNLFLQWNSLGILGSNLGPKSDSTCCLIYDL